MKDADDTSAKSRSGASQRRSRVSPYPVLEARASMFYFRKGSLTMIRSLFFLSLALSILAIASSAVAQTPPYNRTVIVPSTGNVTADGTALISSVAKLSRAPSDETRWLIKLEAGVYDVGTTPVVMRDHIDIEGSGVLGTTIRGAVAPQIGSLGGLVEGADNSEIRSLTIACHSDSTNSSCQGMSLNSASPRLTRLRILVQGTGTGGHWGIRAFNSRPTLNDVEIIVSASNSSDNYGIVYGGASKMDILRSSILARNASMHNWGIVLKESLDSSRMRDSSVTGIGGTSAGGIMFLHSSTTNSLVFDNVKVAAHGGTVSTGIGSEGGDGGKIWFRGGRIFGATDGVNLFSTTLFLSNTEVTGSNTLVFAHKVRIGSTWLRGGGTIGALAASAVCAGVFNDAFTFFPDTCP